MKKISKEKLQGVHGLVLTPFKENYEIDEEGLRKEIRLMVDNGVQAITPVGSTGEFASLTIDEHKKVMVLPPYYYSVLTDEAVFKWYQDLGKADIGIVIYNNPGLTKFNQSTELLSKLAELDHVVAIKEAHGNSIQFYKTLRALGDKIPILEGCGEIHGLETILLGAAGFYSGVAGFVPKLSVKFYNALKAGDLEESRWLSDIFEKFYNLCFLEGSCKMIAHYKAGFEYFGLGTSVTRPPILPITKDEKEKLISVLAILKEEEGKL
jgi:4-hydroxy-tetrahydrodipicolinate synthase